MDNHISEEEFILEFCGNFGREFGNPDQFFVDNPKEILEFVNKCREEKKPAFLSVQPRKAHHAVLGFEKIFYDFDYADKTYMKKLIKKEPDEKKREEILLERKKSMIKEVMRFYSRLLDMNLYPLVVKTKKGYHVYLYFDSVYEISNDEDFWREVYKYLYNKFLLDCGGNYEYVDTTSNTDIFRMARIPLSIHEISGEKCIIVDKNLELDKIRGITYYKNHCLRGEDLRKAVEKTRNMIIKKSQLNKLKEKYEKLHPSKASYGTTGGTIRPCFLKAIQDGEMEHKMRLALELEAWYKGIQTRDGLVNLFRPLHDFDEKKTIKQIDWFLEKKKYEKYKPYSCKTMIKENWCIQNACPRYQLIKERI